MRSHILSTYLRSRRCQLSKTEKNLIATQKLSILSFIMLGLDFLECVKAILIPSAEYNFVNVFLLNIFDFHYCSMPFLLFQDSGGYKTEGCRPENSPMFSQGGFIYICNKIKYEKLTELTFLFTHILLLLLSTWFVIHMVPYFYKLALASTMHFTILLFGYMQLQCIGEVFHFQYVEYLNPHFLIQFLQKRYDTTIVQSAFYNSCKTNCFIYILFSQIRYHTRPSQEDKSLTECKKGYWPLTGFEINACAMQSFNDNLTRYIQHGHTTPQPSLVVKARGRKTVQMFLKETLWLFSMKCTKCCDTGLKCHIIHLCIV